MVLDTPPHCRQGRGDSFRFPNITRKACSQVLPVQVAYPYRLVHALLFLLISNLLLYWLADRGTGFSVPEPTYCLLSGIDVSRMSSYRTISITPVYEYPPPNLFAILSLFFW